MAGHEGTTPMLSNPGAQHCARAKNLSRIEHAGSSSTPTKAKQFRA